MLHTFHFCFNQFSFVIYEKCLNDLIPKLQLRPRQVPPAINCLRRKPSRRSLNFFLHMVHSSRRGILLFETNGIINLPNGHSFLENVKIVIGPSIFYFIIIDFDLFTFNDIHVPNLQLPRAFVCFNFSLLPELCSCYCKIKFDQTHCQMSHNKNYSCKTFHL